MASSVEISVIVSSYNCITFPFLECLTHQIQAPPFEVLICDDGSNEANLARLTRACSRSQLDTKILWQPDRGFRLSRSRNNGIRCAAGNVLILIDSDIWFRPDFLRKHFEAHSEHGIVACGSRRKIVIDSHPANQPPDYLRLVEAEPTPRMARQAAWGNTPWPWMACEGFNISTRASPSVMFDEFFESWGGEDRDFAIRQVVAGKTIRFMNELSVVHVEHAGKSTTLNPFRTGRSEDIAKWLKNRLHMWETHRGFDLSPALNQVTYCHLNESTNSWFLARPESGYTAESVFALFKCWATTSREIGISAAG